MSLDSLATQTEISTNSQTLCWKSSTTYMAPVYKYVIIKRLIFYNWQSKVFILHV